MNLNSYIIETLAPLNIPVEAEVYDQDVDSYIVFMEYNQAPRMNADDKEIITKRFFQVDVFTSYDITDLKDQTRSLMREAGFTRMFESSGGFNADMNKYRWIFRFNYDNRIS
ncbi:hypothetical protein JMA_22180 [Jeotgalibacillus malaysiensis]|uniref:Uncharacterized protein n=1 Tax=Jeotgalibacillus malaysiensis TaxID=1508404 RepID=A0A0B5AML1_9BACL|nr:hypothetical protein [Jeotgalibacillus malaysiensis]AJD91535.1 hypothetical protein JMA_22180 [Jeotgalibacillus malaysiensis]